MANRAFAPQPDTDFSNLTVSGKNSVSGLPVATLVDRTQARNGRLTERAGGPGSGMIQYPAHPGHNWGWESEPDEGWGGLLRLSILTRSSEKPRSGRRSLPGLRDEADVLHPEPLRGSNRP